MPFLTTVFGLIFINVTIVPCQFLTTPEVSILIVFVFIYTFCQWERTNCEE